MFFGSPSHGLVQNHSGEWVLVYLEAVLWYKARLFNGCNPLKGTKAVNLAAKST
jgi:hypothetical protein